MMIFLAFGLLCFSIVCLSLLQEQTDRLHFKKLTFLDPLIAFIPPLLIYSLFYTINNYFLLAGLGFLSLIFFKVRRIRDPLFFLAALLFSMEVFMKQVPLLLQTSESTEGLFLALTSLDLSTLFLIFTGGVVLQIFTQISLSTILAPIALLSGSVTLFYVVALFLAERLTIALIKPALDYDKPKLQTILRFLIAAAICLVCYALVFDTFSYTAELRWNQFIAFAGLYFAADVVLGLIPWLKKA